MVNRKLSLLLAVLMIATMILSACGTTEPAPAPAQPTAAPAAAEPTKVVATAAPAAEPTAAPAAEAAKPAKTDKVSIAYLNKMGDNPWFVDEVAGAKAMADKLGVEFSNQDLQFDSNLAMTAMDTYIGKGVIGHHHRRARHQDRSRRHREGPEGRHPDHRRRRHHPRRQRQGRPLRWL